MASTDHIDLDLDAVERPAEDVKPPFAFTWKGRRIEFSDPAALTYDQVLEVDSPGGFIRFCASQADRDFLAGEEGRMEAWRFGRLVEKFLLHYGYDPNKPKRDKLGF